MSLFRCLRSALPRWLGAVSLWTCLALAPLLGQVQSAFAQSVLTNNVGTGLGGVTPCTVGTSSALCLAAGTRAVALVVQNESATASISCALGATATLNTAGSFQIGPGLSFTFGNSLYVPADAINCIASAAATPVTVFAK